MKVVLNGIEWDGVLVYLDDIIVYACTFDKHLRNLNLVLSRLELHCLTLKPSQCTLFKSEVKFLGHIVSKSGVSYDPEKGACVSNWPIPESLKEVRQFWGLASYYRKFVKDFAKLAAPMYDLTKKSAKQFEWTDECKDAFLCLKSFLTPGPILVYPDFSKPFIVDTFSFTRMSSCSVCMSFVRLGHHDG